MHSSHLQLSYVTARADDLRRHTSLTQDDVVLEKRGGTSWRDPTGVNLPYEVSGR